MPKGQPTVVPDDGLTTRQRRHRPLLMVYTGDGKGKSTAAFGLALRGWNQGWRIAVFQFVKSAKWKVGEEAVETVIEAVRGKRERLIEESADLMYHLLVLWADARITPGDVWVELARREGISGIAEKASRAPD